MKKPFVSLCSLFMALSQLFGQDVSFLFPGSPFITNYTDEQYLDMGKNWGIDQGEDGKMYFANNYGLVQFDGYEWRQMGQPNNQSELRSFLLSEHRIYIGGTSEIGFFEKNNWGAFSYIELTQLIEDSTFTFNDVWEIGEYQDRVFFLTDHGILMYHQEKVQVLGKGIPFRCLAYGIDELVFGANGKGLFRFEKDRLEEITNAEEFEDIQIEFVLIIQPDIYLIGTNTKGIFRYSDGSLGIWNPETQLFFQEHHVREVTILNKTLLLFGSLHGGIIVADYQGNIVNVINEKNGLLDHNVRSIFKDKQGNIWTAVDGSVAYLELNSPFTILNKKNGLRGEVFCILKKEEYLYVGTSRGLYFAEWTTETFRDIQFSLLPNTTGQCWQLYEHQGQILLAHHNGIYTIDKKEAQFLGGKGNWNFAEIPDRPNFLLSGNYAGISLIEKTSKGYLFRQQLDGFEETARELLFDAQANIWISHGYSGIYKMRLSEDLTKVERIQLYDEKKGLPSNLYNNLISIDKGILFGTQNGVYQYLQDSDSMEVHPLFSPILTEETLVRKLVQAPDGNYLSIKDYDRTDQIDLIEILEDGSFSLTGAPFQKLRGQLIPAFEAIYFPNDRHILFGSKHGLIIYDSEFGETSDKTHQVFINEVLFPLKDSVIFSGSGNPPSPNELEIELQHSELLRITYATSFFEALPYTNFSTYLEGFDENWQDWSVEHERTFAELPAGQYTFWVRSKNIYDAVSQSAALSFRIKKDWTLGGATNWWMGSLLFFALLGAGYYWYVYQQRTRSKLVYLESALGRKKQKLEQYKEKKLAWKKEKEHISQKLSNVLLQNEIHAGLVQHIEKLNQQQAASKAYEKAVKDYHNNLKGMQLQMEVRNSVETDDFLSKIKASYPDLSPRELRLCSYLRLNVSSKEIAEYLSISIRGVESLRYRVRKKLGLQKGQDLTAFILNF